MSTAGSYPEPSTDIIDLISDDEPNSSDSKDLISDDEAPASEGEVIDPDKLCPFCDSLLPENPSAEYKRLLKATLRHAWPSYRRENPKGMSADMEVRVGVCVRHRFETKTMPKAVAKGWPTDIDFDALPSRVQSTHVMSRLRRILEQPTTSHFFRQFSALRKQHGILYLEGSRGQRLTIDDFGTGYYGYKGYGIFFNLVYQLFDIPTVKPRFAPLSIVSIVTCILIPEIALALIMEDKSCEEKLAIDILRKSTDYGRNMFPDPDDDVAPLSDDDEDGVSDGIEDHRSQQEIEGGVADTIVLSDSENEYISA
ncbi:hypothetical protein EXIGLDRAFT_777308 [Exidia glandulosa HHB12029]|uniref:Restriction of telomere capping protein 4 n=1 Tax=Exidia glandulosa HHB12029 TaxID=1314781 RepID=A0A165D3M8_EXIGL|nr:hypothetical protein EXIGLDRAFT_777308 [Exidia glandulosa HHB12029]